MIPSISTVIVYVVGGATYEEAKEVAQVNRRSSELRVYLGGSCMHNSKSFLAEVSQLLEGPSISS